MISPIFTVVFALATEVIIAIIGLPAALGGIYATIYATKQGRKRDIQEAVNVRIADVFAKDDATIARLEADRARLELKLDRLDLKLEETNRRADKAEEREEECLERERLLDKRCSSLERQVYDLELFLQPRRGGDG